MNITTIISSLVQGDCYAGIGSRETPGPIQDLMTEIAGHMSRKGLVLRSGGAARADSAFEKGIRDGFVDAHTNKEIYLPWKFFNKNRSQLYGPYAGMHEDIAKRFHPAWGRLSDAAKKFMIRNTAQIFGMDFDVKSKCVICYTSDGKASGGTGQAIRIAQAFEIPVCILITSLKTLRIFYYHLTYKTGRLIKRHKKAKIIKSKVLYKTGCEAVCLNGAVESMVFRGRKHEEGNRRMRR